VCYRCDKNQNKKHTIFSRIFYRSVINRYFFFNIALLQLIVDKTKSLKSNTYKTSVHILFWMPTQRPFGTAEVRYPVKCEYNNIIIIVVLWIFSATGFAYTYECNKVYDHRMAVYDYWPRTWLMWALGACYYFVSQSSGVVILKPKNLSHHSDRNLCSSHADWTYEFEKEKNNNNHSKHCSPVAREDARVRNDDFMHPHVHLIIIELHQRSVIVVGYVLSNIKLISHCFNRLILWSCIGVNNNNNNNTNSIMIYSVEFGHWCSVLYYPWFYMVNDYCSYYFQVDLLAHASRTRSVIMKTHAVTVQTRFRAEVDFCMVM